MLAGELAIDLQRGRKRIFARVEGHGRLQVTDDKLQEQGRRLERAGNREIFSNKKVVFIFLEKVIEPRAKASLIPHRFLYCD